MFLEKEEMFEKGGTSTQSSFSPPVFFFGVRANAFSFSFGLFSLKKGNVLKK
jgi:hypothetical protein